MSCIPRILELKGDKEFLAVPTKTEIMRGVIIEDGGHYKGYDYLITFNDMGFRCGYVAISPDHPFYNKNLTGYSDNEEDFLIDVHGGITFFEKHSMAELLVKHPCEDKWIGFDCGHAGDLMDLETALKIFSFDEKISSLFNLQYKHLHCEVKFSLVPMVKN